MVHPDSLFLSPVRGEFPHFIVIFEDIDGRGKISLLRGNWFDKLLGGKPEFFFGLLAEKSSKNRRGER